MAIPVNGPIDLDMIRKEVQRGSGSVSLVDRRVMWLAFLSDNTNRSISFSDLRGKNFDTSWVEYGNEVHHQSMDTLNPSDWRINVGDILGSSWVEGEWQQRWKVVRTTRTEGWVQHSSHGRNRHGKYSRSRDDRLHYYFNAYKKIERRAW